VRHDASSNSAGSERFEPTWKFDELSLKAERLSSERSSVGAAEGRFESGRRRHLGRE
jgi:hypothetical protein